MQKGHTIGYYVSYLLTFFIIYFGFQLVPSKWVEIITAQFSAFILNRLGLFSRYGVVNDVVFLTLEGGSRDVYVSIIRECTAIHVWGILLALVVPLDSDFDRKLKSIVFGAVLVFFMNISRILITVFLTGYDVMPFSWFFQSPTVETYHYPVSFLYGVIGVMILILTIDRYFLPELGELLVNLPIVVIRFLKKRAL
jgi:exosortase/archaeosortase family protein